MTHRRDFSLLSKEDQELLGEMDEERISQGLRNHALRPLNLGSMKQPDGQVMLTGICDDVVLIQLHLDGVIIDDARFQTNGCGFTKACGSAATEMVKGKSLSYALAITGEQIDATLGGLPQENVHCAHLTANAMKSAAQNALGNLREPWKRMYRGWQMK